MKKIEKVSIANISFALDSDAYVSLKRYLDSLHAYYDKDPDGGEIIADIEARIAELILDEQIYTKIVSRQLIDSIVAQLGMPEEMDGETGEKPQVSPPAAETSIPRRLYRRREGRVFGGVCSGMASFWDIEVIWVRLLFLSPLTIFIVLPFGLRWWAIWNFMLGWSWVLIIVYIVMWLAIPLAKTPRQKLEARGEKITPSSIRQNLQEGAKTPASRKAASVAAEILAVIGRVLLFCIKFAVAAVGFAFVISALAIFIGLIVALISPVTIGLFSIMPLAGLTILPPMVFLSLLLVCVMIPLLILGAALLSIVFNWKPGRLFYFTMFGIWLISVILCSIVAISNVRYLNREFRTFKNITEWVPVRDLDKEEIRELWDFLDEEDNGTNIITINVAGNSIEIESTPVDSVQYVGADSIVRTARHKQIVIREARNKKHNRTKEGRVVIRRVE